MCDSDSNGPITPSGCELEFLSQKANRSRHARCESNHRKYRFGRNGRAGPVYLVTLRRINACGFKSLFQWRHLRNANGYAVVKSGFVSYRRCSRKIGRCKFCSYRCARRKACDLPARLWNDTSGHFLLETIPSHFRKKALHLEHHSDASCGPDTQCHNGSSVCHAGFLLGEFHGEFPRLQHPDQAHHRQQCHHHSELHAHSHEAV